LFRAEATIPPTHASNEADRIKFVTVCPEWWPRPEAFRAARPPSEVHFKRGISPRARKHRQIHQAKDDNEVSMRVDRPEPNPPRSI